MPSIEEVKELCNKGLSKVFFVAFRKQATTQEINFMKVHGYPKQIFYTTFKKKTKLELLEEKRKLTELEEIKKINLKEYKRQKTAMHNKATREKLIAIKRSFEIELRTANPNIENTLIQANNRLRRDKVIAYHKRHNTPIPSEMNDLLSKYK